MKCVGVYTPPSTNKKVYFEEVNELLEIINAYNYKTSITEDFIINLLDDSFLWSKVLEIILTRGLYLLIYKPTRSASESLLDNIFGNLLAPLSSHVISYELSDHYPLIAFFNDLIDTNKVYLIV